MTTALPAPKKGENVTTVTLGRYLEKSIDKVRVLEGGTLVAIRRAPEDKNAHTQRWTLEVLAANAEAPKEADDIPF